MEENIFGIQYGIWGKSERELKKKKLWYRETKRWWKHRETTKKMGFSLPLLLLLKNIAFPPINPEKFFRSYSQSQREISKEGNQIYFDRINYIFFVCRLFWLIIILSFFFMENRRFFSVGKGRFQVNLNSPPIYFMSQLSIFLFFDGIFFESWVWH